LESFQNFNVGGGSSAPELNTIGPECVIFLNTRYRRVYNIYAARYEDKPYVNAAFSTSSASYRKCNIFR
jgi:hypothetical protein